MRRLFYSTVAMMVVALVTLCGSTLFLGGEVFAKHPAWSHCPLPDNTATVDLEMQHNAWTRAKLLADIDEIRKWKRPCRAVRMLNIYRGDPDGEGGLPDGNYAGMHQPPMPLIHPETGDLVACEYVFVFLPEDTPEEEVELVLTHEYLHAIFYRLVAVWPAFRQANGPEMSEPWVRWKMGDYDWLKENNIRVPE
jgi:hypothetical protein